MGKRRERNLSRTPLRKELDDPVRRLSEECRTIVVFADMEMPRHGYPAATMPITGAIAGMLSGDSTIAPA